MNLFVKIHFEWIMLKIDKLKVVKIVRQQFTSTLEIPCNKASLLRARHVSL